MDDPTLDPSREPNHAARVARWFQPSPPELAGLAVLVLGAIVVSALLWFQAAQRPSELGSGAASAGVAVGADGSTEGPAPGVTDEPAPHDDAGGSREVTAYGADEREESGHGVAGADGDPVPLDVEVTVHVTGAVASPGLVTLPGGSRVGDAVAGAGGLLAGAMDERTNLARPLVDGEHVHVLREGEEPPPAEVGPGGSTAGTSGVTSDGGPGTDGKVDINRAGAPELETLPGVGPARAEAIVAHREQHGPFTVPGDLRAVSGIGEIIFQRLAELVTVG